MKEVTIVEHEEIQNNQRLPFYFYHSDQAIQSEHWHQEIELNYLIKGKVCVLHLKVKLITLIVVIFGLLIEERFIVHLVKKKIGNMKV